MTTPTPRPEFSPGQLREEEKALLNDSCEDRMCCQSSAPCVTCARKRRRAAMLRHAADQMEALAEERRKVKELRDAFEAQAKFYSRGGQHVGTAAMAPSSARWALEQMDALHLTGEPAK